MRVGKPHQYLCKAFGQINVLFGFLFHVFLILMDVSVYQEVPACIPGTPSPAVVSSSVSQTLNDTQAVQGGKSC